MTDKLANVKKLLEAVGLDGYGARKYTEDEYLNLSQRYLHQHLVPALYVAIKLDDPTYEPYKVMGEAIKTDCVQHYIWEVARDGQALYRSDPTHPAYHLAFDATTRGCFFNDLVAAYKEDVPEWVPDHPVIASNVIALDVRF